MRYNITIVACQAVPTVPADKESFPNAVSEVLSYAGMVPDYCFKYPDNYMILGSLLRFHDGAPSAQHIATQTRKILDQVYRANMHAGAAIVMIVENMLLEPMIDALEEEREDFSFNCFVCDPVEFPEIPTTLRRITAALVGYGTPTLVLEVGDEYQNSAAA